MRRRKKRPAESHISKSKRVVAFEVRRKLPARRKQIATNVLESALCKWAIDQLYMGSRLNASLLLAQASLIANDLRALHEVMIERGEQEVGSQLRLPLLEGRTGSTYASRFMFKAGLSCRMTHLQFKIDKRTQEARMTFY